ncbi:DUF979 domain-containing protein|uniref:Uncharacterized membrane protein n=1 Tax=Dendrosporobacter quercicolus TaxID=146817 RepID=A0A1G9T1K5_9FIRM|nr:DUF979 domain-containing protein [Dendrosporobacter quercicolus]NSL48547.1 DUF979 domain-containing protein [Dendrosporobacter quercicolus DSM 1736]SDM41623.1 Uncharacterized membrane protein [Dendrosporobacter quercicolus]
MLVSLSHIYDILGILVAVVAVLSLRDTANPKRFLTGAFWGLYAITFLLGNMIDPLTMGLIAIAMAVIAGCGGVCGGKHTEATVADRTAKAKKLGSWLFLPALLIPIITVIGTLGLKDVTIGGVQLLDKANVTLVSLGVACVLAWVAAMALTKDKPLQSVKESRRLFDAIGWATVLPQMLATLGAVFAAAGVGQVISDLVSAAIPVDNRFLVVFAYTVGMALFTMIMGNAFAAFPVMTAGVGLPLIVNMHGGDPAILAAIGMFSGYCGTLMTPMAANFNIVPAALLDLPDKNGVIKVQIPTALLLLGANVLLMYFLVF